MMGLKSKESTGGSTGENKFPVFMEVIKTKRDKLIPKYVAQRVITVGPQHINHRGGVGAVIHIYSKYFQQFNYVCSHKEGTIITKSALFIVSLFKFIFKLLFNRKIKIVHIHGASYGSFYRKYIFFIISKYLFGKKVFYHIHGGKFHLFYSDGNAVTKRLVRSFLNNADCIICLSLKWKEFFEQNFSPRRVVILSNIVDFPSKSKNVEKDKRITFLFLGYISDNKGVFDLLEILSRNKKKYGNKLRLIIGGNGETERLQNFIHTHDLNDIVEFIGWISGMGKAKLLQTSDVYILPSYNEGLPISILEAMSYGKAIISSGVGGIPEIVIPHKNGILIEPGKLDEIESAVDLFLENSAAVKSYGEMSKEMVKKYLPKAVMNNLLQIYRL